MKTLFVALIAFALSSPLLGYTKEPLTFDGLRLLAKKFREAGEEKLGKEILEYCEERVILAGEELIVDEDSDYEVKRLEEMRRRVSDHADILHKAVHEAQIRAELRTRRR